MLESAEERKLWRALLRVDPWRRLQIVVLIDQLQAEIGKVRKK